MQGLRLNIIITLILTVISLHLLTRTLRNVSSLVTQSNPVALNTNSLNTNPLNLNSLNLNGLKGKSPKGNAQNTSFSGLEESLFAQLFGQSKKTTKRAKKTADTSKTKFALADLSAPLVEKSKPHVLQILSEEPTREVKNPALSKQECIRLTNQLAKDRMDNAQLTQEIEAMFGTDAQQEAIVILTKNENAAFKNASTCASLKKCLKNQERLDKEKQEQLITLFKAHKGSFNYKAKSGSDSWNNFYQRINSFRRAQD